MYKIKISCFIWLLFTLIACNKSFNNNLEDSFNSNIDLISKEMWNKMNSYDAYFRYLGVPQEVPDGFPSDVKVFVCYTYGEYNFVGQDFIHSDITGNNYLYNKEKTAILPYELIGLFFDGKFNLYSENDVEFKKFEKVIAKSFPGSIWMSHTPTKSEDADSSFIKDKLKNTTFYRIVFDKFSGPESDDELKAPKLSALKIDQTPLMSMYYDYWSNYNNKNEPPILYELAFKNEQFIREKLCDTLKYNGVLLYEKNGHGLVIWKNGPLKSDADNFYLNEEYVYAKDICDTIVGDWRLPTKDELIRIYVNRNALSTVNFNDISEKLISSTVSPKYGGVYMVSVKDFLIWENCFTNETGYIWPVYSF